jgi:hypothetical protein
LKSEGFRVIATKKKSLALHVCGTTNQKGGMHDFGFLGGRRCFSLLGWLPPFSSLILFIS